MLLSNKTASRLAMVAATGAVACGACCVAPFAMPAVALAFSGGAVAWLAARLHSATTAAATTVGLAWLWIAVESRRARARPSRWTLAAMLLATATLGLALLWPRLEPFLVARFKF